jgi:hypothetical protein
MNCRVKLPWDEVLIMCRNIKKLRSEERPPTDEEIREAALQFVRKVSGYRAPSRANQEAFNRAVEDISGSVRTLLAGLVLR